MRADLYLYSNGYTKSRQKAKDLIESNCVIIDKKEVTKPSFEIDDSINHEVIINDNCIYVSRGGLKLEAILNHANIDVNDKICIDIGASTGGFTDCLLKRGAKEVFAVDSGTNQLDSSLRNDKRVTCIENFNARNINIDLTSKPVDIVTIDVSFISQTLIMPEALDILNDNGLYISLIKPQFEVGKSNIGKGGIVKDKKAKMLAISRVIDCARLKGYNCQSIIKSPILGGDGNTEYLAVFSKICEGISTDIIKKLINS